MPRRSPKQASPQPHDALFRFAFAQREHAAGLLKASLPEEVTRALDFRTLRVEKGSFVNAALRSRHGDLVLSARLGGQVAYFYALVEQQREVERLMVVRMGSCMMRLWEELLRDRPARRDVPPIYPLLIHHSETGWTAPTAFEEVVAAEGEVRQVLLPHIPRFELRLVDLSEGQASRLVEEALTALGRLVLWCLSVAGDDERLEREIGRLSAALEEVLGAPDGLAALGAVLRYIAVTHAPRSLKKVVKLMEKAGPRTRRGIVTWLDEIELKGVRKGVRKGERMGERKGRVKSLLQQLAARFGEVPAEVTARVEAASEQDLERWTIRVLTAPTPEEVLDDAGAKSPRPRSTQKPAAHKRSPRAPAAKRAS